VLIVGVLAVMWVTAPQGNVGELRFANALRIPPLLDPRADGRGRKLFDLTLQAGRAELLPGTTAESWGVNGPYLGPTLRADVGDEVAMRVRNELPEATTTIHWHGMHLPAAADGGPHQPIEPGATWTPSWTIDQPAATLWYHPHPHRETEDHVYRGLAGMFILDDPAAERLRLPDEYGVDDVPVIIQDMRLDDDGSIDLGQSPISPIGRLGDDILVNGTYDPHLEVTTERVRLRLLNASTARVYDVGFDDGRSFALVATEQGLVERPRRLSRLQLSVGERAEIVVELSPGERTVLRSFAPELGTDFFNARFSGGDDSFDLLQLRAAERLAPGPALPDRLAAPPAPDPATAVRTRSFELSSPSSIDGRSMDMERIDQRVRVGTTEVWEVRNEHSLPHSFHPHDVRFRILEFAGGPPPPALEGLKDTVLIPPGETVRFVTEFSDYADDEQPYMFHCHLLQHEDRGMMGQFVVTDG
jgi:FtsP/CotA-like multicopper oxidase with cupredoxin domain